MNKKDLIKQYFNRFLIEDITEESITDLNRFKWLCKRTILDSIERDDYSFLNIDDLVVRAEYFVKLYIKHYKVKKRLTDKLKIILKEAIKEEYQVIKNYTKALLEIILEENIVDTSDKKELHEYILYELDFLPAAIFGEEGIYDILKSIKRQRISYVPQ